MPSVPPKPSPYDLTSYSEQEEIGDGSVTSSDGDEEDDEEGCFADDESDERANSERKGEEGETKTVERREEGNGMVDWFSDADLIAFLECQAGAS